jgi:hypothetical protein
MATPTTIQTATGETKTLTALAQLAIPNLPTEHARTGHVIPGFTNNYSAWENSVIMIAPHIWTNTNSLSRTKWGSKSYMEIENQQVHVCGGSISHHQPWAMSLTQHPTIESMTVAR